MAKGSYSTEIDTAEDPELEEEAGKSTSVDEFGEGEEAPPEESDEKAEASSEDAKKGKKGKKGKAKGAPSAIAFYAVPALGAVLILSLGWGFAFIARSGLERPEPEKPPLQAQAPPLPKAITPAERGTIFALPSEVKEKKEKRIVVLPKIPVVEIKQGINVSLKNVFFIPLEGNRGKRNGKTRFLNISLNILVSNKTAANEVSAKRLAVRQVVYDHFNRLSYDVLATPRDLQKTREQLVAKLSKVILQGEVRDILFDDLFAR
jgi:hypothetical protein